MLPAISSDLPPLWWTATERRDCLEERKRPTNPTLAAITAAARRRLSPCALRASRAA